jgi:hypothetical protein
VQQEATHELAGRCIAAVRTASSASIDSRRRAVRMVEKFLSNGGSVVVLGVSR